MKEAATTIRDIARELVVFSSYLFVFLTWTVRTWKKWMLNWEM